MTTIYSELIEAAGAEFLPQAEGEPDGHYLRRLVLAVSKCSDEAWEALSTAAHDWYNAQAKRVKAQQDPEECPGFNSQLIVDVIIDAGWPTGPELPKSSSNDVAHQDSPLHFEGSPAYFPGSPGEAIVDAVKEYLTTAPKRDSPHIVSGTIPLETDGEIVDAGALHDAIDAFMVQSPKHTATDAVRAIVMQHQDWKQAQIMRELESQGRVVSISTIATVRSMTLATIAVAKGLGKWVEG